MDKCLIVGSGPSALVCASVLRKHMDVTIIERGEDLKTRFSKEKPNLVAGLGGSGSTSDGKYIFNTTKIGSTLADIVSSIEVQFATDWCDKFYLQYGAPEGTIKISDFPEDFKKTCRANDFDLIVSATRHWGSDAGRKVVENIINDISKDVEILTETTISPLLNIKSDSIEIELSNGDKREIDYLILAPGRSGADFMKEIYDKNDLPWMPGATDLGIRYECKNEIFEEIYKLSYEPKMVMQSSYGLKTRLFCANLHDGKICQETYNHLLGHDGKPMICVNGHSFSKDYKDEEPSGNSNFAILATALFSSPFRDSAEYCRAVGTLINELAGGGTLLQSFDDIIKNRRSTWKRIKESGVEPSLKDNIEPGDIGFGLPYKQFASIIEFIHKMSNIFPGLKQGLCYCLECKFYGAKATIDGSNWHYVGFPNVFPLGDASGHTRSLAGSSAHGYLVGQKILGKSLSNR